MKDITLAEFKASLLGVISGVVTEGDVVRVDCREAGAFVVLQELEYKDLRDALALLFALVSMDELREQLASK